MRNIAYLLTLLATVSWTSVQAQSATETSETEGHPYLGGGFSSLALDNNDRIPGVATSSPSHSSKLLKLILGYQFNEAWSTDLNLATDVDNADVDEIAINGYRYFGSREWRPFISAGLSHLAIDDAPDDSTQQVQGGFGVSGNLNRNLELRLGYQHLFTVTGDDFQDKELTAALAWHFRKPQAVAAAEPVKDPEPVAAPEPEVIETYELQVQFDFDKSDIKSAYEPQFQEIAQVLKDNPDITLSVEGHTCWIGTEIYNQGLSERRASAVKTKFVDEYGIDPGRIATEGFGESRPVADNTTLAGRQRNRRSIAVTLGPENVSQ